MSADNSSNSGNNIPTGRTPLGALSPEAIINLQEEVDIIELVVVVSTKKSSKHGRGFRQLVSLFEAPDTVIDKTEKYLARKRAAEYQRLHPEAAELNSNDDDNLTTQEKEERDREEYRAFKAYQAFERLIPDLKEKLSDGQLDHEAVDEYLARIARDGDAAKNTDTSNIRVALADWLNQEMHDEEAAIRVADPSSALLPQQWLIGSTRQYRGLDHDKLGGYLVAVDSGDWNDVQYREAVRNGDPDVGYGESYYARVFYAHGTGTQDDVETGFLRGPLLVKVARYIFTSPSSVLSIDEDLHAPKRTMTSTKKHVKLDIANLRGMTHVTPRVIAYCAVQLHFNLTDAQLWPQDGIYMGYNYHGLYSFIVDYFEQDSNHPEDQRAVDDLLKWWNSQLFPASGSANSNVAAAQSLNRMAAQRAARRVSASADMGSTGVTSNSASLSHTSSQ
ncbi:hypothetical protein FISHEDRAFT_69759 [Fistulina hepatica ATCC 64428]|uniref:Uncharacterized protein n=1 Tax=Fistulina hepatica ATCC 64428 TaxID=1128425 RepID=A0A0D7ALD1_9AGAR|nr:hypothetical protein FISHEDRAFT_69759 [Fistulina hepatica ATCC 64428]